MSFEIKKRAQNVTLMTGKHELNIRNDERNNN